MKMALKISNGYVQRYSKTKGANPKNLFLVKYGNSVNTGYIYISGHKHTISLPKEYIGKRIRIKIEVIE